MLRCCILILLPALTISYVHVKIVVSTDENESYALVSGEFVDLVSDNERTTFGIQDEALKRAVEAKNGQILRKMKVKPDEVFIKDPTRFGNIFAKHKWRPVHRKIIPVSAKIISLQHYPTEKSSFDINDTTSINGTIKVELSDRVRSTVNNTWALGGQLEPKDEIKYSIVLGTDNKEDSTFFEFPSNWGDRMKKELLVARHAVEEHDSKNAVGVSVVTKSRVVVEVKYEATLDGQVFCNYGKIFKGHHFYGSYVKSLLAAARYEGFGSSLGRPIRSTQHITIDFHSRRTVKRALG